MLKKNKTVHLRVETTLRIPVTLVLGLIQVWACSLPPSVASLEINQPSKWGSRLHLQLNYSFSRKDAGKGSPWTWRNACIQTFYYLRLQTEIETITSRQSLLLALHPFCIKRIKEKVWQKKKKKPSDKPTYIMYLYEFSLQPHKTSSLLCSKIRQLWIQPPTSVFINTYWIFS